MLLKAVLFVLPAPTLSFPDREFPTVVAGNMRELSKCSKSIFVSCKVDKIKITGFVLQWYIGYKFIIRIEVKNKDKL